MAFFSFSARGYGSERIKYLKTGEQKKPEVKMEVLKTVESEMK